MITKLNFCKGEAMDIFAQRLKQAMKDKSFKQVDLINIANEQGVKLGKSHVSQYVSGKTVPRGDIMKFLAMHWK